MAVSRWSFRIKHSLNSKCHLFSLTTPIATPQDSRSTACQFGLSLVCLCLKFCSHSGLLFCKCNLCSGIYSRTSGLNGRSGSSAKLWVLWRSKWKYARFHLLWAKFNLSSASLFFEINLHGRNTPSQYYTDQAGYKTKRYQNSLPKCLRGFIDEGLMIRTDWLVLNAGQYPNLIQSILFFFVG